MMVDHSRASQMRYKCLNILDSTVGLRETTWNVRLGEVQCWAAGEPRLGLEQHHPLQS